MTTREETLRQLQKQVAEYIRAEKLRLTIEREFLQSVLENSLGGAEVRAKRISLVAAVDNVKDLLGFDTPA